MSLQVARLVASSFALVAFALAIAVGLSAGNPADAIISRALFALIAAAIGGYVVGLILEHLVRVTSRRIDASADAMIAEEEEALHAALHPHATHGGHGHGATVHGSAHSPATEPSAPRTPQPVVGKSGA